MVTKELLQELFSYDNGNLYWKNVKSKKVKTGQKVGSTDRHGYMRTSIKNKIYSIHRLIWIFHYGEIKDNYIIDHKDRNILNNKIENLRLATHSQNIQNSGKRSDNKSGYKNVFWAKDKNKWRVRCYTLGKSKNGGYYDSLDDAAIAATALRKKVFGEFAQDGITC